MTKEFWGPPRHFIRRVLGNDEGGRRGARSFDAKAGGEAKLASGSLELGPALILL